MTLQEYLQDYASAHTRSLAPDIIERELNAISSLKTREITARRLQEIIDGKRDFRF